MRNINNDQKRVLSARADGRNKRESIGNTSEEKLKKRDGRQEQSTSTLSFNRNDTGRDGIRQHIEKGEKKTPAQWTDSWNSNRRGLGRNQEFGRGGLE